MFIIIVFRLGRDMVFSSSQDFFCFLLGYQSQDATPRLEVSVILEWFFISHLCIFFPATVITTM